MIEKYAGDIFEIDVIDVGRNYVENSAITLRPSDLIENCDLSTLSGPDYIETLTKKFTKRLAGRYRETQVCAVVALAKDTAYASFIFDPIMCSMSSHIPKMILMIKCGIDGHAFITSPGVYLQSYTFTSMAEMQMHSTEILNQAGAKVAEAARVTFGFPSRAKNRRDAPEQAVNPEQARDT